jgi:hypothetical protein
MRDRSIHTRGYHFYDQAHVLRARVVTVEHVHHALRVSRRDAVPPLEPLRERRPRVIVVVREIIARARRTTRARVIDEHSSRSSRRSRRRAAPVDETR